MTDDAAGLMHELADTVKDIMRDLVEAEGYPERLVTSAFMVAAAERLAVNGGREALMRWSDTLRQAAIRGKRVPAVAPVEDEAGDDGDGGTTAFSPLVGR